MKLKLLLFTFALISGIVAFNLFNNSVEGPTYEPRDANHIALEAAGQFQYNKMINSDPFTGELDLQARLQLRDHIVNQRRNENDRSSDALTWVELGPDNIAGRVRAIESDDNNTMRMFAGGVSGGLWSSQDGGLAWSKVEGFDAVAVTSIAILGNGNVYVGTGSQREYIIGGAGVWGNAFYGRGLFKSTDGGENFEIVSDFEPNSLNNNDSWSSVDRLVADPNDPNKVWIAYGGGMRAYIDGNDDLEPKADGLPSSNTADGTDIDISDDGQVIACIISNQIYISSDGGQSFEDRSGGSNPLPTGGVARNELTLDPQNPNNIYVSMSNGSGYLHSVWASDDTGQTFDQIAFSSNNGNNDFSPFAGQGWYDQDITVVPGNPNRVLLAGVATYRWEKAIDDPIFGQWDQATFGTDNFQGFPGLNMHADAHYYHWTADGNLYVGTDGGIYFSPDQGLSYFEANLNLNITQNYDMAFGPKGQVLGGTQDNSCPYIDFSGNTPSEARRLNGGDGFDVGHSQLNDDVLFMSSQNSNVTRSNDGGNNISNFSPFPSGPFYTVLDYWETDQDFDSPETVIYSNVTQDTIFDGETINYASKSLSVPLEFEAPDDILPGDSLILPDPVSTWYATASSGSSPILISRNAANFNTTDFEWIAPTPNNYYSGTILNIKFSPDGDHMYVGTSGGRLYRVSGLADVYSPEEADISFRPANNDTIISVTSGDTIKANIDDVDFSADTYTFLDGTPIDYKVGYHQIYPASGQTSGSITAIAIDANDNERVAISMGSYNASVDKVVISNEAQSTTENTTFSNAWNPGSAILESMPVYSITFDKLNPDRLVVGTEFGIFISEDEGDSWAECFNGMGRVPVHELLQQTLTEEEYGVWNENVIYAGTMGRGFYYAGDFAVGVDELEELEIPVVSGLNIYPNPLTSDGTVSFKLNEANDVKFSIYNLAGNLVETKMYNNMSTGQRIIEFNAADLANGIYLVSLQINNTVEFGKFIKQ